MFKALFKILEYFAKGGISSFMTHAGLSLVVFSGLDILVTEFLEMAVSNMNQLPSAVIQLALLSGVGNFLSITGSAVLTRVALVTAMSSVGLSYKGKGGSQ